MATIYTEGTLQDDQKATTLDEDLKVIRDAKYDHALEAKVCDWICKIIGRAKPANEPASIWLKSGDVLCTLMNCIRPGTIPKYNSNTTSKFKQMENISLFLRACREVGMLEKDLFSTIDLYEVKDMNTVILTLFNLGGTIQSTIPYFTGPTIGIKQTNRKFQIVPPIKNAVAPSPPPMIPVPVVHVAVVPKLEHLPPQAPVMQTMLVAPAPVIEESLKHVHKGPEISVPAFTPEPPARQPVVVREIQIPLSPPRTEPEPTPQKAAAASQHQPMQSVTSTAPSVGDLDIQPRKRNPLNTYKQPPINHTPVPPPQQYQAPVPPYMPVPPQPYAQSPAPPPQQYQQPVYAPASHGASQFFMTSNPGPSVFYSSLPMHPVAAVNYQGYGSNLLKQVNAAALSQFGQYQFPSITGTTAAPQSARRQIMPQDGSAVALEQAVQEWIESVLRERKPNYVSLFQWLQTGEVLCRMMNAVLGFSPNPNFRISSIAPNDALENYNKFIHVCKALGVKDSETFVGNEFFQGTQNGYMQALNCVFCLGGVLQNYEWWVTSGNPQLGRRIKIGA